MKIKAGVKLCYIDDWRYRIINRQRNMWWVRDEVDHPGSGRHLSKDYIERSYSRRAELRQ
jgi:hypothetical protein